MLSMRLATLVLVVALVTAGCRSTYHARAEDLPWPPPADAPETVPAVDEDGERVRLRVDSIVRVAPPAAGRQEAVAADGRAARTAGLVILGTGLAVGLGFAASGSWGSDTPIGPMIGIQVAVPMAVISAPFLIYGLAVGSPEE